MRIDITAAVAPAFKELAEDVFTHRYTHYRIKGGRGSTKSSFVAIMCIALVMADPRFNVAVFRRYASTLRCGVFGQYCWAVSRLGLDSYFTATTSPMELKRRDTGQRILFLGGDEPEKIKSVKVPKGYIAITHFEELDQFADADSIRMILQSTMRGGDVFWNFETLNPPMSPLHWTNVDEAAFRSDRKIHSSTYETVPVEWLGSQFFEEAKRLKAANEALYRREYLGEAVWTQGETSFVFDNIVKRRVSEDEITAADLLCQGLDFGWYPDKLAFVRLYYDRNRDRVIFFDEIYENRMTNQSLAEELYKRGYAYDPLMCDSAEPKSIFDLREMGIKALGVKKGRGSISYGIKWLQSRPLIIDPERTPHLAKEFCEYEYLRSKDGQILNAFPDSANHLIDATRYALERTIMKGRPEGMLLSSKTIYNY